MCERFIVIFFRGQPRRRIPDVVIDDCYPLLARRNERDGSVQPVHGQAGVPDDQDGGGRTSFRVGQHCRRFRRYRQERKAVAHTHCE